jgi:hypothetical protein
MASGGGESSRYLFGICLGAPRRRIGEIPPVQEQDLTAGELLERGH